ncbi:MAG: DUF2201 family putative metallopeptidase [Nitriliruptoraceae bacterium]
MSTSRVATDVRRFTDEETETLAAARLLALRWMPYLASALFEAVPVRSPDLDTFAVDAGWRLYVGVPALERWSVEEVAGVLLHEVGHLLRDHHARHAEQEHHDHDRWNLAADAEINDDLVAARIPLPGRPVTPERLGAPDGDLAERYYHRLLAQEFAPAGADASADARSDVHAGAGPGQAGASPGRARPRGIEGDPDEAECHARCGSGAGGAPVDDELTPDDDEHPARTPVEQELTRRVVASDIAEVMAGRAAHDDGAVGANTRTLARGGTGPHPGSLPGGWRRWASEVLAQPAIDWRQRLRRTVRRSLAVTAGQLDHDARRPGRRRVPRVVTPGMVQPRLRVGVVVDTSASMETEQLDAALAELDGLCRRAGIRPEDRVVLTADVAVREAPRLRRAAELELLGGGGTDLRPALEVLRRHPLRPTTLVVLTDGFTPWPVRPLAGRAVIAVVLARRDGQVPDDPPAWVETIRLDPAG